VQLKTNLRKEIILPLPQTSASNILPLPQTVCHPTFLPLITESKDKSTPDHNHAAPSYLPQVNSTNTAAGCSS